MNSYSIRPSIEADIPGIAAIYGHAVQTGRASFELEAPDLDEMARRRAALVEGGFPYLVACQQDGFVLGYAYAGAYRPRPAYRNTVESSVYVHESAHGRGVGRALMMALIDLATTQGFRQMVAVIGDSANKASIGLHQAVGFRLVGVFQDVGWKHEQWLDTVLMQRPLGSAATTPP